MSLLFCYGSLKKDGDAHHMLGNATFRGKAVTRPSYRLYHVSWFPGMVRGPDEGGGVHGELYEVPDEAWADLDEYECVDEGLFVRAEIEMNDGTKAFTYLYNHSVEGRKEVKNGSWKGQ